MKSKNDKATGKIAIVLLQMGGPHNNKEVRPFLQKLFSDRDLIKLPGGQIGQFFLSRLITSKRHKTLKQQYQKIGGGSPIQAITKNQANELEVWLNEKSNSKNDVCVFHINRYSNPRAGQIIKKMAKYDFTKIILLSLYPHNCRLTTGSSVKDFNKHFKKGYFKNTIDITIIDSWYQDKNFNNIIIENIEKSIAKLNTNNYNIIFSAHAIPKRVAREDSYQKEIEHHVQILQKKLNKKVFLSYQSQSRRVQFTGPATKEVIENMSKINGKMKTNTNTNNILIYPISFVSDHLETLYEIDITFANFAKKSGINNFIRVESMNTNPKFITALGKILMPHLSLADSKSQLPVTTANN